MLKYHIASLPQHITDGEESGAKDSLESFTTYDPSPRMTFMIYLPHMCLPLHSNTRDSILDLRKLGVRGKEGEGNGRRINSKWQSIEVDFGPRSLFGVHFSYCS